MIIVCRPYDGITINEEVEYLLDDNGNIKEFSDVDTAKQWLKNHDVSDDYMDILMFVDTEKEAHYAQ